MFVTIFLPIRWLWILADRCEAAAKVRQCQGANIYFPATHGRFYGTHSRSLHAERDSSQPLPFPAAAAAAVYSPSSHVPAAAASGDTERPPSALHSHSHSDGIKPGTGATQ